MSTLFPGFDERMVAGDGAQIFVRTAGSGPALMLLHGFPQTGAMWHRIAGRLAEHFSVVIPDLRGYGRSEKPENDTGNLAYSKRAMGNDLVAVMKALGHDTFHLAGHDRGGRVAYRMAQDHSDAITKLVTLDIIPTYEQWQNMKAHTEMVNVYHWPFLAQKWPLPERMIDANPDFYLEWTLASWTMGKSVDVFDPGAMDDYRAHFRNPAVVHAMCNDYRAGATCDVAHDREILDAGKKITAPMLALWGDAGIPGKGGRGLLDIWQTWADNVQGQGIKSGHFIPEEAPDDTCAAMLAFLQEA